MYFSLSGLHAIEAYLKNICMLENYLIDDKNNSIEIEFSKKLHLKMGNV